MSNEPYQTLNTRHTAEKAECASRHATEREALNARHASEKAALRARQNAEREAWYAASADAKARTQQARESSQRQIRVTRAIARHRAPIDAHVAELRGYDTPRYDEADLSRWYGPALGLSHDDNREVRAQITAIYDAAGIPPGTLYE